MVSAVDGAGNEGEYSNEAQATIPTGMKAERLLKYPKSFLLMQNYPDPFNQGDRDQIHPPQRCSG